MEVQLSDSIQELVKMQAERDGFVSTDAMIERAIRFYESHRPTMESLNESLLAAHRSAEAGDLSPLDADEIKRRGRERLASRN